MPTYTLQDCMDKIQDISTNLHSCLTALSAKGVTVPADASLDDLGGLIRQIPDASHPDYELPWVMTDGSTCVWLPTTMGKARSFAIECELAPTGQSSTYAYILGVSAASLSNIGLMYHDTSVQASRKLTKSVGQSGQTADVDNNARVSWTGWPFYKKQSLACSFYSTSGYRSSLQYRGSWTHAGTASAQQSSSGLNDVMTCLFSQARYSNTGLTSPYTSNNCPAGTKVYGIKRWSTLYSDITTAIESKPYIHWDPINKEYKPCFRYDNANNYEYSSFPKTSKLNQDGTLYYLDVTQGYQERSSANTDGTGVWRCDTDIPNSSAYTIMMGVNQAAGNDNWNEYFMDIYGVPANTYFMYIASIPYSSGNTARIRYHEQLQEGVTITENYDTYVYTGQSASNNVICIDPSKNTTWYSNVTNITDSKHSTALTGKSTAPDASRGYYRIYNPYYGSASINRILYWVAIYEGTTLKHYLVNCTKTGTNGLMYDVVTKKSYNFYKV